MSSAIPISVPKKKLLEEKVELGEEIEEDQISLSGSASGSFLGSAAGNSLLGSLGKGFNLGQSSSIPEQLAQIQSMPNKKYCAVKYFETNEQYPRIILIPLKKLIHALASSTSLTSFQSLQIDNGENVPGPTLKTHIRGSTLLDIIQNDANPSLNSTNPIQQIYYYNEDGKTPISVKKTQKFPVASFMFSPDNEEEDSALENAGPGSVGAFSFFQQYFAGSVGDGSGTKKGSLSMTKQFERIITFHVKRKNQCGLDEFLNCESEIFSCFDTAKQIMIRKFEEMRKSKDSKKSKKPQDTSGLVFRFFDYTLRGYRRVKFSQPQFDPSEYGESNTNFDPISRKHGEDIESNSLNKMIKIVTETPKTGFSPSPSSTSLAPIPVGADSDKMEEIEEQNMMRQIMFQDDDEVFIPKSSSQDFFAPDAGGLVRSTSLEIGGEPSKLGVEVTFDDNYFDEDEFGTTLENTEVALPDEEASMRKKYTQWVVLSSMPKLSKASDLLERKRKKNWEKVIRYPKKHGDVTKAFKKLIREGVPVGNRRFVWTGVTGATAIYQQNPDNYEKNFQKIYSAYFYEMNTKQGIDPSVQKEKGSDGNNSLPEEKDFLSIFQVQKPSKTINSELMDPNQFFFDLIVPRVFPSFGGVFPTKPEEFLFLNPHGQTVAKRLLCILAVKHPEVEFCPTLPRLVPLMLMYMSEKETFLTLHCMLTVSKSNCWYFNQTKLQNVIQIETCCTLLRQKFISSKLNKHFQKTRFSLEKLITEFFDNFFIPYLSYPCLLRLLDCYINEGYKLFFRIAAAILKILEPQLLNINDPEKAQKFILFQTSQISENVLFQKAFSFPAKRSTIKKISNSVLNEFSDLGKLKITLNRFIIPKVKGMSEIISMGAFETLVSWIPHKLRIRTFTPVFFSSIDGYSLRNLYRKLQDLDKQTPVVVLFRAVVITEDNQSYLKRKRENCEPVGFLKKSRTEGEISKLGTAKYAVFGAFVDGTFSNKNAYEGNAETFVFNLFPDEKRYCWTEKNNFFVLGGKRLCFGGGGDGPAITVDDELCLGSSRKSDTFGNPVLTGYDENEYRVLKTEVWSLK